MSEVEVGPVAETNWLATLEVVVTRRSHCPDCGFGTEDPGEPGVCRCGQALVGVEPVQVDMGVLSGLTRPCPACGYTNDPRRDACKRCGVPIIEVEPTEEADRSLLAQIADAWRRGWKKGT
jgi:hypothetical protein